jgi:hypothetical protein
MWTIQAGIPNHPCSWNSHFSLTALDINYLIFQADSRLFTDSIGYFENYHCLNRLPHYIMEMAGLTALVFRNFPFTIA